MKKILILGLVCCAIACMGMQGKTASEDPVQRVTVQMRVPDPGWSIAISEVCRVGHELWIISRLQRHPGKFPQVITRVEDSVDIPETDLPVVHVIIGKTWNWSEEGSYRYIQSRQEIADALQHATCIYENKELK